VRTIQRIRTSGSCLLTILSIFVASVFLARLVAPANAFAERPEGSEPWTGNVYAGDQLEPSFYNLPENIEVLRLENGLQVILMRNPAQPMVGIYTQVRVGSAYEDFRTSGMSHMLEHLLFNGTSQYTQQELYDLTDMLGAYNNANTSDFYTNFMLVLPAGSLEAGLGIQSQMLFHSLLPEDKFEKERGIIIGELVSGRDMPGHFTDEAIRQALYENSSLELPTLGTKSTIEHMSRDDVFAFYKQHYVPNNMMMTVAGNFARERILTWLEETFGAVPPGTLENFPLRPANFIDRTHTVVRRGGDRRVLVLAFDAPGYGSADYFPFLVMTRLLDVPGSGIVTRALAGWPAPQRPEFSVWWEKADGFSRLVCEFELPREVEAESIYRFLQEAAAAALEEGITTEDVVEVVRMEETETLLEREQLRHTGIMIAAPIVLGGVDFFLGYLHQLRQVTAEDVARVLRAYVAGSPCLAVLVEPEKGEPATAAGMAGLKLPEGMKIPPAMLEALKKQGVSPAAMMGGSSAETEPTEEPAGVAGAVSEAQPPLPEVEALPVQRSVLSSGAVLVTQENPASALMAVHLTVRGRAVIDGERPGALNLVHRLLLSGYSGCDQTCLSRKLRRLGAVVKLVDDPRIPMDDYYTDGRFAFVRVELAADRGPELLELLAEFIQRAGFTEEDFEREVRQEVSLLEKAQASARYRADELLRHALYGDHPLVNPPEGDLYTLQDLTYDQTRAVYRRAFSPANLIFAIVSPSSHEQLAAQLERLLPARGQAAEPLPPLPLTVGTERVTGTTGGEMAAIRVGSLLRADAADVRALELLTAILSDRLAMDLREKRGLSYSVGASLSLHGGEGEFEAWLNPPRERMAEGEQALRQFLADFDVAAISAEELAKVRNARRGRMLLRRLSSISQAYYLAMAELDGNATAYNDMLTAYDEVTLADLQRVDRTYLRALPLVTVVVD
jgi:predicted Zn-dependent peptidase